MVEKFSCGLVPWADRYFGRFDWKENLIGIALFFFVVSLACLLSAMNPARYLVAGMAALMWILASAFLHISTKIMGREYSPGVVTATVLCVPAAIWFLSCWHKEGVLTWEEWGLCLSPPS